MATENVLERDLPIRRRDGSQKANSPEIHTKDGDRRAAKGVNGSKDRSVAAKDDDEVWRRVNGRPPLISSLLAPTPKITLYNDSVDALGQKRLKLLDEVVNVGFPSVRKDEHSLDLGNKCDL
jgi:hypothetical protein